MKQSERNRRRNRARKAVLKTETRRLLDVIKSGDVAKAKDAFVEVTKRLDKTAASRTLHKNTAARRKSRLAKRVNAAAKAKTSE